jgi:hypothetical protein
VSKAKVNLKDTDTQEHINSFGYHAKTGLKIVYPGFMALRKFGFRRCREDFPVLLIVRIAP